MLLLHVSFESVWNGVEVVLPDTTNKAVRFHIFLDTFQLVSKFAKSVDNQTQKTVPFRSSDWKTVCRKVEMSKKKSKSKTGCKKVEMCEKIQHWKKGRKNKNFILKNGCKKIQCRKMGRGGLVNHKSIAKKSR